MKVVLIILRSYIGNDAVSFFLFFFREKITAIFKITFFSLEISGCSCSPKITYFRS